MSWSSSERASLQEAQETSPDLRGERAAAISGRGPFVLVDGLLYRDDFADKRRRLVIPASWHVKVIRMYHHDTGHFGVSKTV